MTANSDADVIFNGEAGSYFGESFAVGDLNADSKIDLAVGAAAYSSNAGRAYIFYNDGTYPTDASSADVRIGGEASSYLGKSMATGDFNADGETDLAVGAYQYSTNDGRVYIFNNDGTYPTAATSADAIINGESDSQFGRRIVSADLNADGKTDLAVNGSLGDGDWKGKTYFLYNDGSYPASAGSSDVIITGEAGSNFFGSTLAVGDLNNDGNTDIVAGASGYSSSTGRVYLFYNQNGMMNTNRNIQGEGTNNWLGYSSAAGDFNADGKTDLAVCAYNWNNNATGRTYIFYNDGSYPTGATSANVIIEGETTYNEFGISLVAGDFNADGETDLAVGADRYASFTGRVYIFYNDGSYPTGAASAEVIIQGESSNNYFGYSLAAGDFNADGETDLAVGAKSWSGAFNYTGRAYIFYNDGSYPTGAASAEVIIQGENIYDYFGYSLAAGDFNADGETDLAVGAYGYSTNAGRVYIFYNDGSYPTAASSAEEKIGGEAGSYLGKSITDGDFNADGRIDLAVGADGYSTSTGRAYIFYNDGSYPTGASSAEVIIQGESSNNYFGYSLAAGDFNADGETDLAVGAYGYSTSTGRAYIFYNDGTYPSSAGSADVIITGENSNNNFGYSLTAGDFNSDKIIDLIVGAHGYSTLTGRVYFYEGKDDYVWEVHGQKNTEINPVAGEMMKIGLGKSPFPVSGSGFFDLNGDGRVDLISEDDNQSGISVYYNHGSYSSIPRSPDLGITFDESGGINSFESADLDADGDNDLIAANYNGGEDSGIGRVYIFYNDDSYPNNVSEADVVIDGEGDDNYFGRSLAVGDFNSDGDTDLAVGATGGEFSSDFGRVYIFYNDGAYPSSAASADVIISQENSPDRFGYSLTAGNLDGDSDTDLVVGAYGYSTFSGRAYIFYNDGTYPSSAGSADVIITGENEYDNFGYSMKVGNLDGDSDTDLVVGAYSYSFSAGRVYIFNNDGTYPSGAGSADVIIDGEASSSFGLAIDVGSLDGDSDTDLVVGASSYEVGNVYGRVYIFRNDGSYPSGAGSADEIMDGVYTEIGDQIVAADINNDGRSDLYFEGYIYFNDGDFPEENYPDDYISGEIPKMSFSSTVADFNSDGKDDLATIATSFVTEGLGGSIYIFFNDGAYPISVSSADLVIKDDFFDISFFAEPESGQYDILSMGGKMSAADYNADGRTDLAVSGICLDGDTYETLQRIYIFYNDGSFPGNLSSADTIIGGAADPEEGPFSGQSIDSGDFNDDDKEDLITYAWDVDDEVFKIDIFYNDGAYPSGLSSADIVIENGTSDTLSSDISSGDFNADGKNDLAIRGDYAIDEDTSMGRIYIFYNDGSYPASADLADVIIEDEESQSYYSMGSGGKNLICGDFNADGETDLASVGESATFPRIYIFYNDGSYPSSAANADVIIDPDYREEEYYESFGSQIAADFNGDGRTDICTFSSYEAVLGEGYDVGFMANIFYNDGSYPSTSGSADKKIAFSVISDYPDLYITMIMAMMIGGSSGDPFSAGDLNFDGKIDLVLQGYNLYIYTLNDQAVTGEEAGDFFGGVISSGDFNADGKIDLAVGAPGYNSDQGRTYLFYNDGNYPGLGSSADVVITGESSSFFSSALSAGDFNADGKTDLAAGANRYNSAQGRAYIFLNDGAYPSSATSADNIITGEGGNNNFGVSLAAGDLDADGETDLAVGAYQYNNTSHGRVYLFRNDGSYPTGAGSADAIITGEGEDSYFGVSLAVGDFNADGKTDLTVGASRYNDGSENGRIYFFYNDGSYPSGAGSADAMITGEAGSEFSTFIVPGDINADGKTDLVVADQSNHVYLFYNDGSYPSASTEADWKIEGGEYNGYFGSALAVTDVSGDGKADLLVGDPTYDDTVNDMGRVYLFYNDGDLPRFAASADVITDGPDSDGFFGFALSSGRYNSDGINDYVVGAGNPTIDGKLFIFMGETKSLETMDQPEARIKGSGQVKFKGPFRMKSDPATEGEMDGFFGPGPL